MSAPYSDQEIKKILLENLYIYTADELCRKWGLTKYQLRKWKKAFNYAYLIGDLRDMTLVALHTGATNISDIQNILDYLNHCLYSEAEIVALLEDLKAQGIARQVNGEWFYDRSYSKDDSSFIF